MPSRQNFSASTIRTIAQRAAYLCSNPNCRCLTTTADKGKSGVEMIGEAAHIIAATADGPRGQEALAKYGIPGVASLENAIWLCSIHHKQIDDHPNAYPVETLLAWKKDVEAFTRRHLGRNPFQTLPGAFSYTPPLLPDPGELPDCSNLPPGSHLPLPPNHAFTGRQRELRALARDLLYAAHNRPTAIVQPAALSGSGGIGKTQLAVEFCYRYGPFFYGVHWLQADQELDPQIAACGEDMHLSPWPETLPEQMALTLQAWQVQPHRLVVLDNLQDPQILLDLPAPMRAVKLLVTARRGEYDPTLGVRPLLLELLPRADSLALLRRLAPRLARAPDPALDALAERLGDYPLALHLAGLYLNLSKSTSPCSYLAKLAQPGSALDQDFLEKWKQTNPTHYEHTAGQAFRLSWNQLDVQDPVDALAQRCFLAAGFCAANTPIPSAVLRKLAGEDVDELAFAAALERLQTVGLASPADSGPMLHPMLAEFARWQDAATAESALPALAIALAIVSGEASRRGAVAGYLPLLPHLRQAGDGCRPRDPARAALMDNNLGMLLQAMGDYPAARPYYEQALAIRRAALGKAHPDTATSLNNLGLLLQAMGDYSAARPYLEQALAIRRAALGEKHLRTAASLNNLGMLLYAMGDYPAARTYYEQALAIWREVLGEAHPDTATSLNNLGLLLQDMGDYPAARPYYEQALAIRRAALGKAHPYTATSLNNLGSLLYAMGDYPAARPYLEQALSITKEALGEEHPDTAIRLNNLGMLLYAMGDLPAARTYYEQALAIFEATLGPDHPNTQTCRRNLAALPDAP